jgi:hypothetical protein
MATSVYEFVQKPKRNGWIRPSVDARFGSPSTVTSDLIMGESSDPYRDNCCRSRATLRYVRKINCEIPLLPWSCLSVCPSIYTEQLGFHWIDFRGTLDREFLLEPIEKVKWNKNERHLIWNPTYFHVIVFIVENDCVQC